TAPTSTGCSPAPSRGSAAGVNEADTRVARLRLIRTAQVGPVTYRQLLRRFGTAEAALEALPMLARRGGGPPPAIADAARARREIDAVERLGARHLFLGDPDYPPLLAELDSAPPALILRGSPA